VALVDAGKTGRIQAEVCTRYRDRTGIAPIIFVTRAAPGVALLP
jgi:galactokinase